ncbi:hypothetical protein DICSQDRAFT_124332 [Dichomitus squalens LYAD-421 SS1]|uniref:uncharacterized protein n=1 Tax=Dichomitus squalens (strain LYAD-421) TaxID=732165 RepID=UPI00044107F1|nr:uncharacterized protein DICSQDRAFT_124332 [Dichomitus squalens LYAD-421 SS1]EJF66355.1 hypothetical protein DICSQDRAFT_124332 [Dichomitus squalens LYAD-421 SS1]
MHVYVLGGSKNIGYFAGLRLLKQGATITYLLRSPNTFDNDAEMQLYIQQGKAQLVRGDGLNLEDVRNGWQKALEAGNGKVDVVLFTIGGTLAFTLKGGLALNHPNLCTQSLLNVLSSIPSSLRAPDSQPHFVVVTSMGCTAASHKAVPLSLKLFYNILLPAPHADKLGAERVLAHVAGLSWQAEDKVKAEILPEGWEGTPGLPGPGELKHVVVIWPSLLTDGVCKADEERKPGEHAPYRALKDGHSGDAYRISRKDTAHFIVHGALANWDNWEGSRVTLAY